MKREKVAVFGLGYVGLPMACVLAESGLDVVGVDIDHERVSTINSGRSTIEGNEPGLPELVHRMVGEGRLKAVTDPVMARGARACFVCVDTPIDDEHQPVLSQIRSAVTSVGKVLEKDALVSIESTLPPGTMVGVVLPILEGVSGLVAGKDFSLVHCPERVMPGKLLNNMRKVERVLGCLDGDSLRKGAYYYSKVVQAEIHPTTLLAAEIVKTTENAYRDVQIAFANEVGLLCEQLGADAFEVRRLVNTCPFRDMHIPGAGVGGHCLPKDSWLLLSASPAYRSRVIAPARSLNEEMPIHTAQLARGLLDENVKVRDPKISVLGLAFLRDSDDTRNSPAIRIIDELVELYANVVVHDPFVKKAYKVPLTRDLDEALCGSDCAVFVTDHSVYRDLTLVRIKEMMRTPVLVDGRNLFNQQECVQLGIVYKGVGKG
jgi:UDP-N-acetyl-D-mannosaminuronic acid dehydrogenase